MVVNGEDVFYFFYDGNGKPMLFMYNGIKYFYATNLQGDVTAIVSVSGAIKAEYTYDAWGNILSVTGSSAATLGKLNPLRYRGYVYDDETKLYYLQSRYYDPNLGRFINADIYTSTAQGLLGNNMFAYCGNNPVSRKDPTGNAFVQMSFDPTGISGMLTPGPWGGGSGGVGFAASAISSFSSDAFAKEVVNSKAYQIAEAFLSNIEVSAGFGMGLRVARTVLEWIGVDVGLSYDLVSVTLSDWEIYIDQKFWCGVEVNMIIVKAGEPEEGQRAYGTSAWQTPPQSNAIEIFGDAVYLFAGASYSVSFRADSFFAELSAILFD